MNEIVPYRERVDGTAYAFGGIVVTTCIALTALILTFVNGRDWRERYDALAARTAALEVRVAAYDAIGTSPAVLQEALDRYWRIAEAKAVCDFGGTYRTGSGAVVQCFVVRVPEREDRTWLAGL